MLTIFINTIAVSCNPDDEHYNIPKSTYAELALQKHLFRLHIHSFLALVNWFCLLKNIQ